MAKPNIAKGTKLRLLMGDGAAIEVFSALCGLTAKGINFQTNTNQTFIPDCDNPDDPAWQEITKSGRFASISGSGLLDMVDAFPRYRAAYESPDPVNMRVYFDLPAAQGGGYWIAAFSLTDMNITGNDGENVQAAITLQSDGPVQWVPTT